MKIGFDTSALDPNFKAHFGRGIGRYVAELNKYFSNNTFENIKIEKFDYKMFPLPQPFEALFKNFPVGRQTIRQQLLYPLKISKLKEYDLLHFPAHMDAPIFSSKPYILTVLDLIPLVCRDMYERDRHPLRYKFARFLENTAIKKAKHIIAISDCTAKDINKHLSVPLEKISVVPLGVDERFFRSCSDEIADALRLKLKLTKERPIILYVGGIDQRKNIDGLINIFEELRENRVQSKKALPHLLIAGRIESDRQYPKLLERINRSSAKEDVILTGFVPDEEVAALFKISNLFLFPSFYEGFGLPPLEAMAAGVPVVSSNTSSIPEVLGDCALYFTPSDTNQAVKLILNVLEDQALAKRLSIEGVKQARKFSWDKTGEETVKVYKSLSL